MEWQLNNEDNEDEKKVELKEELGLKEVEERE